MFIHNVINRTVNQPDRIAVCHPRELSYGELLNLATGLAQHLANSKVGKNDLVVIWTQCPLEGLIGLLAALLRGAVYIPLDPKAPFERVAFIVADAKAKAVIADQPFRAAIPAGFATPVITRDPATTSNQQAIVPADSPDSAIYAIYTSGSTGAPKGVLISQRNIAHFIAARNRLYGEGGIFMPLHPQSFDPAQGGYLWTLAGGGCLVLPNPDEILDCEHIARLAQQYRVSHISIVPILYNQLLDYFAEHHPPALQYVLLGGETLPEALVAKHFAALSGVRIFNEYGPTEATVFATVHEVSPDSTAPIPIGKPVYENACYILDDGFNPVPQGEFGELFIGGPGVGIGYLGNPALTAEKFLTLSIEGAPAQRFYRTGDRVRLNENNLFEFSGRFDYQIKLRGNRIEPGEIESVAGSHPAVKSAVVILDEIKGVASLRCFYTTIDDQPAQELPAYLHEKLPPYMVPSSLHHLLEFPLSGTGKVDRKALKALDVLTSYESAEEFVFTPDETKIVEIWQKVLLCEGTNIRPNDSFFSLGGDSLLFVKVKNNIKSELKIDVDLSALYQHHTVKSLASHLASCALRQPEADDSFEHKERYPIAPVQEIFFYLSEIAPDSSAYIETASVRIAGHLDLSRLIAAIDAVVAKHEIFRAQLSIDHETPCLIINENLSFDIPVFSGAQTADKTGDQINAYLMRPFVIQQAPLFRFCIQVIDTERHQLFFAAHHLIIDGISIGQVFEHIWAAYDKPDDYADITVTAYQHFAEVSRRALAGDNLARLYNYWEEVLADNPTPTALPKQFLPHSDKRGLATKSGTYRLVLPAELYAEIRTFCSALSISPFMLHLAVFSLLIHRYSNEASVFLGTPVSVRNHRAWENTIGCFINTVGLRIDIADQQRSFSLFCQHVKMVVVEALQHADIPFHWLKEKLLPADEAHEGFFKLFINYIDHRFENRNAPRNLEIASIYQNNAEAKFDLTFYIHELGDCCELEMVFDSACYSAKAIEILANQHLALLKQSIGAPETTIDRFSLASNRSTAPARRLRSSDFPSSNGYLQDAFFAQARNFPARVAIVDRGKSITYGNLASVALKIARDIDNAGIAPGSRIAVYMPRSYLLCASLIAILEQCIFTILDPEQPDAHNRAVLEQFAATGFVTDSLERLERLLATGHAWPVIVVAENLNDQDDFDRPEKSYSSDLPAYVVFTSGTTGKPKGVLTTHSPAMLFVNWQKNAFGLTAADHFSLLSGLSHDPVIRDIFAPLSLGATLCIPAENQRKEPQLLAEWMAANAITITHQTPSLARTIFSQKVTLPQLRKIFLSGERLRYEDITLIRQAAPNVQVLNCYGTTETPQIVSCQNVSEIEPLTTIPIGSGSPQFDIRVVDRNGNNCGIGELGEVIVSSPHLGRGYLSAQGISALSVSSDADLPEYRTGDIGRYDENLNIHIIDRKDRQVKINGYRIELSAVEAAIKTFPEIVDVRVINIKLSSANNYLAAFVIVNDGYTINVLEIKDFLQRVLIGAAVPAKVVFIKQFPLTANGKIDERRLALGLQKQSASVKSVEPRTQSEEIVTKIWREVLGLSQAGINTDFFEAGGDSIQAVKALLALNEAFSQNLTLEFFVAHPTPATFAEALSKSSDFKGESQIVKINDRGTKPPFWMLHPIGGHVIFARRFSQALGDDWPVYAIQARGLDGKQKPFYDLKEMAAHYIKLIKEVQPAGPYNLGGPSMGGRTAFEIALQLTAMGEQVNKLIMFDSWAEGFPQKTGFWKRVQGFFQHYFQTRQLGSPLEVSQAQSKTDFGYADYQLEILADDKKNVITDTIQYVIDANKLASRSYAFSYYPGTVTLFSATVLPTWRGVDFSDSSKGWQKWTSNVEIIDIETSHQKIMDEPALSHVVEEFKKLFS